MSRMPPTESSDLSCLNREEGETISLDYQDLNGVQIMEKLPSEAFSFTCCDLVGYDYGRDQAGYGFDGGIPRVENMYLSDIKSVHDGDDIAYSDATLGNKEYTDLSNKAVIENSLDLIRTAIEGNTIPTGNRHIIEQSIYNLQTAMEISKQVASDKGIPIQVNTNQSVSK